MSTIQQLKNFIRHGKQARVANADEPSSTKQDNAPSRQQQTTKHSMESRTVDPALGVGPSTQGHGNTQPTQPQPAEVKVKHKQRVPEGNIAKLVAEENERKSKFPVYPGLERWELLEKMGDGAFSNVYRARDKEGDAGEVAIKVVRKFEMNSIQVRGVIWQARALATSPFLLRFLRLVPPFCPSSLYQPYGSF
ncbi:hypothetical protein VTK26DRAFT_3063 [Humicola hyalothermophila]